MKYPINQFEKLKEVLNVFKNYFDLSTIHTSRLHYLVYQQLCDGQPHNKLLIDSSGKLVRATYLDGDKLIWRDGKRLIENDFTFELYPNNTNDSNIETAIKKAIKEITN